MIIRPDFKNHRPYMGTLYDTKMDTPVFIVTMKHVVRKPK